MGCWVSGMSDPHVTAASSAFVAFSTAFPTRDKQVEVFQYGFKAIINVCSCVCVCICMYRAT